MTGLHLDDARVVLNSAGFEEIKVHYVEDYLDDFHIAKQEPGSGILIDRAMEILLYVSRTSLVHYLPRIYQQSAKPGSFLRGFLYVIQQMTDQIGTRLDRIHELFDPRSADPEFLPWVASWTAITLNSEWDELQTRKMLMAATQLFPYRGTAKAIRDFVRIYTDSDVVIEENSWPFKGFRIGVHSTVGLDTVILPPMNLAHCFVVRLDKSATEVGEDDIIRIHEIIQSQKPAHASYFLAFSDESDGGEMGAFMTIGGAGIGVGGVGMGVGVGGAEAVEVVEESSSDGDGKKSSSKSKDDDKKSSSKSKDDDKKSSSKSKDDDKKSSSKSKDDDKKSSSKSNDEDDDKKTSKSKKKSGKDEDSDESGDSDDDDGDDDEAETSKKGGTAKKKRSRRKKSKKKSDDK